MGVAQLPMCSLTFAAAPAVRACTLHGVSVSTRVGSTRLRAPPLYAAVTCAAKKERDFNPRPPANKSLANLHELTERIADLLQVGSLHKTPLHCPKDAPLGYLSANRHVVVVFGKHLIRDQITVEYAKRVVTLVKQIASGQLNPDVICFTGGRGLTNDGGVSEAAVGYTLFRNICEEAQVDVSKYDFILEDKSRNTKENLANVIEELRRREGSDAVAACHFTLVSSDYHLIRIQEVHRLSPRQSILFPLEVSSATWNCIFAAYPFCVSQDPATAFLGRAVVLANDLGILLVNLNGALDDRQFVSQENLHRLNETFAKIREMYRVIDAKAPAAGGFRADMRAHAETLEMAIHNIREAQTLLSPLQETGGSVSRSHLQLARDLLQTTSSSVRASMDPDRVLRVHDRLAIIEDMIAFVNEQRLRPPANQLASTADIVQHDPSLTFSNDNGNQMVDDTSDPTLFQSSTSTSRAMPISSEVTWRGGAIFKGNGKKITRDGPNLVITDSGAPGIVPNAQDRVQGRVQTRTRRRTVSQTDALAGTLTSSLMAEKAQISTTSNRSTPRRTRSTTTRKPKTSSTTAKKRKTSARKVAQPSTGETP